MKLMQIITIIGSAILCGCASVETGSEKARQLAPRIDDIDSKSFQVIKLTEGFIKQSDFAQYPDKRTVIEQRNIISVIETFKKKYAKPPAKDAFSNMANEQEWVDEYNFLKSKWDPHKLDKALKYFETQPKELKFVSHFGTQYSYDDINWSNTEQNLIITNFVSEYKSDDWSPYAFILNWFPTKHVGYGKFSFSVDGENIDFRSSAQKAIWSFSNKYWGYAKIFSTENGKDKAPLLIQISHPMNPDKDNGFYLVIPK